MIYTFCDELILLYCYLSDLNQAVATVVCTLDSYTRLACQTYSYH